MGRPRKGTSSEPKSKVKTIQGYIIKEDKPAVDEELFSDEDDDFDFAGNSVKKVPLHKTKVRVQTLDESGIMQSVIYVIGKFPFLGQWWHITVSVKEAYGAWYTEGLPCYRLREDLVTRKNIFNVMIHTVLKSEDISSVAQSIEMRKFTTFLERQIFHDYSELYKLPKLVELLTKCAYEEKREPEQHAILALIPHLHKCKELKVINVAINCPALMLKLPLLLPKLFTSLVEHGVTKDDSFLPAIDKMIVHKPYELAFLSVIKKKTGTSFSEVHYDSFNKAGIWAGMEQPYKDAVMIYYVLKDHCMSTGDTYMSIHRLNGQTPRYKGHILRSFRQALDYLISNGSVVEEDERAYLKKLYEAEVNICTTVADMIESAEAFSFDTDFETEPLKTLASDPDQYCEKTTQTKQLIVSRIKKILDCINHTASKRRAAELISKKAVVVMSGRGGCGKTEVVSRVCQVALQKIYQQKKVEHDRYVKSLIHRAMGKKSTNGTKLIDISEVDGTCKADKSEHTVDVSTTDLTEDDIKDESPVCSHDKLASNNVSETGTPADMIHCDNTHKDDKNKPGSSENECLISDDLEHASPTKSSHTCSTSSLNKNSITKLTKATGQHLANSETVSEANKTRTKTMTSIDTKTKLNTEDRIDSTSQEEEDSQVISYCDSDIDLFADDDDDNDIDGENSWEDEDNEEFTVVKGKAVCESTQLSNRDLSLNSSLGETTASSQESEYNPFSDGLDEDDDEGPPPPDESKKSYILLTAPTGKAAKVLGKRTGFTGFTLHQIMFRYMLWVRDGGASVRPFPFREVVILVVDECSLVAVSNLSFLLSILTKNAKLQRIIFLGDTQQLPSIEPGNFLTDLYSGLSCKACSITLRTNHRSEGKLIIENAIRISGRAMPIFDKRNNFQMIYLTEKEHIDLVQCLPTCDVDRDQAVRSLVKTEAFKSDRTSQFVAFRRIDCEAVNNVCAKMYTGQICIDPANKKPMFHEDFKICCSKNGTVPVIILHDPNNEVKNHVTTKSRMPGTDGSRNQSINGSIGEIVETEEEMQERLRQEVKDKISEHVERAKNQSKTGEITEEKGAELETQIANEEEALNLELKKKEAEKKKEKAVDMRLCNGEIFWIKSMFEEQPMPGKKALERWIIESEDGMTLSVHRRTLMKECRMKPCWCRTIHTYQGSEIKHLAYVVGAAGRQNWQHVYTAVTRGKSSVTIIGEEDLLRKAVGTAHQRRFCCLEEKIKERFLGLKVKKANPDTDPRVVPKQEGFAMPAAQTLQQYISEDEFNDMIDEEMVWGDNTFSNDTVSTQMLSNNFTSAASMVQPPHKKLRMASNAIKEADGFDSLDDFQQEFEAACRQNSQGTNDDTGFSTEDEDDFIVASQHMDHQVADKLKERKENPLIDSTDPVKIVNCTVVRDETNNVLLVPESIP